MGISFFSQAIWLLTGISVIVLLTVRFRVHAFFALLIASFIVGFGMHLPAMELIATVKDGFGNILKSLGLIIILGTTLGVLLEHTGSTRAMASFISQKLGGRHTALSMSITGFIVGLPIFCDSGYIVLSGLNTSLARRTGVPMAVMATSLASGLYAVHCLIPPHPGASAAAGMLHVEFGKLIMMGMLTAIPAALAGYCWARYAGRKWTGVLMNADADNNNNDNVWTPPVLKAFLPVLVPIALIALRSFVVIDNAAGVPWFLSLLSLGDPVFALSIGILLALNAGRNWKRNNLGDLLREAADKAGGILVIIGAGGAFGAVLAATKIGTHLSTGLSLPGMGIWFPFLAAFILKTAQGSSTVAIMTAAALVQPLLPSLQLDNETGRLLCVLAMGAGSMMISHANDAYFWVISKFSGLEMKTMIRVYSVATIWMGTVSMVIVYILSKIL